MVFSEWSLPMFGGHSRGPCIVKEKRERQQREEEMNCQPW